MDAREAVALLAPAVPGHGGIWADLGAGTGTFTLALAALLGPQGRVFAVDRDRASVDVLHRVSRRAGGGADVVAVRADFTRPLARSQLGDTRLDGALLANALHFVPYDDQPAVLERITRQLRPGGRIVLVEYEGRRPSRWVPFPVELARFDELADIAGLTAPTRVGSRPSAFGATMYAAYAGVPERAQ
jgi:ubiquinone/menaquinone biosynthesis C-methylase UbiE